MNLYVSIWKDIHKICTRCDLRKCYFNSKFRFSYVIFRLRYNSVIIQLRFLSYGVIILHETITFSKQTSMGITIRNFSIFGFSRFKGIPL